MTAAGLTPRQAQSLAFIQAYIVRHGYSPSYQDIADALGLASKSNIVRVVAGLVARGHLSALRPKKRSLAPTAAAPASSSPSLFVDLGPDLDFRLRLHAEAHGIPPEAAAQRLIAQALGDAR